MPPLPLPPPRRHFDVNAKDLVRRLLTADKTKRIGCLRGGAEDIKAHKWFERLSWDAVLRCTLPVPFTPKVSPLWFTDRHGLRVESRVQAACGSGCMEWFSLGGIDLEHHAIVCGNPSSG